jgi:hypothetical protein
MCVFSLAYIAITVFGNFRPAARYWGGTALFQAIVMIAAPFLYPAQFVLYGRDQSIVAFHFFNYFYSLPFMPVARAAGIANENFTETVVSYLARQAGFAMQFAPAIMLLVTMTVAYLMLRAAARYAPNVKAPAVDRFRSPGWLAAATVAVYAAGAAAGAGTVFSHGAHFVWNIGAGLLAVRGAVVWRLAARSERSRPAAGTAVSLAAVFFAPVFIVLVATGAADAVFNIEGLLKREGPAGGDVRTGLTFRSRGPLLSWAIAALLIITAAYFVFKSGGGGGGAGPFG